MNNEITPFFKGRLNGKQRAIGFIIIYPLYFYVIPMFCNVLLFLYLKYISSQVDYNTLNVWLNLLSEIMTLTIVAIVFKSFIIDNIKGFMEKLGHNLLWCVTVGIAVLYGLSIGSNLIVQLFVNGSGDSANQMLFVTMLKDHVGLMVFQAVILAPILEELLFRGLLFGTLREKNVYLAHIVSAFVFGFIHIYNGLFSGDITQLVYLISYGAMGFAFSFAYEKRGTICAPIVIHMINNAFAIMINLFM